MEFNRLSLDVHYIIFGLCHKTDLLSLLLVNKYFKYVSNKVARRKLIRDGNKLEDDMDDCVRFLFIDYGRIYHHLSMDDVVMIRFIVRNNPELINNLNIGFMRLHLGYLKYIQKYENYDIEKYKQILLHESITCCGFNTVRYLIEKHNADFVPQNYKNLHKLMVYGKIDVIKYFMTKYPVIKSIILNDLKDNIHDIMTNIEAFNYMLSIYDTTDIINDDCLIHSIHWDHYEVFVNLFPMFKNNKSVIKKALYATTYQIDTKYIQYILLNTDININTDKCMILHEAIDHLNIRSVKYLFENDIKRLPKGNYVKKNIRFCYYKMYVGYHKEIYYEMITYLRGMLK